MEQQIREITEFLGEKSSLELKCAALEMVLGLTGSHEGSVFIISSEQLVLALLKLLPQRKQPKPNSFVARDSAMILLNISSLSDSAEKLVTLQVDTMSLLSEIFNALEEEDSIIADQCCMILANLSRQSAEICELIFEEMRRIEFTFEKLLRIFGNEKYNKEGASLHYIGPFLSNMTQIPEVRSMMLDRKTLVLQRLLPFTEYAASAVRRGGIIGCLKNCCFDTAHHNWLLGNQVSLLSYLLLPLAGPEEFKEEENEELPPELQYLGSEKEREQDPDIRRIILETLLQLCATKNGREVLRKNGTYYILRELHNWEKDVGCRVACENLVDIMIRKEDEIGHDNLKELAVPEDLTEKFHKEDTDYVKALESEVEK